MLEGSEFVGLSDLLDQDITSYEYFNSLPREIQRKLLQLDINSFDEMVSYVTRQYRQEGNNFMREPLNDAVYRENPELADYFANLPPLIRERLLESGVEISTLGELQQCATHFMSS